MPSNQVMEWDAKPTDKPRQTKVTFAELVAAQGGTDQTEDNRLLWVLCPDDYDPALITAEDIIDDPAICLLRGEY